MVVYVDDIVLTGDDVVGISELKVYLQSAISEKKKWVELDIVLALRY